MTGVKSCSSATTINECSSGYVLLKESNNCVPCYGNGATCTIITEKLNLVACATGYFHSSVGECTSCASIKAADGKSNVFSSIANHGIKTC